MVLSQDFLLVGAGFFGMLLLEFVVDKIRDLLYQFWTESHFSVSGCWITRFSPPNPLKGQSIEIVRLKQKRDRVSVCIENYNSVRGGDIRRYVGDGRVRLSKVSVIYCNMSKELPDLGALVLHLATDNCGHPVLRGKYDQLVEPAGEEKMLHCSEEYQLKRIDLPWRLRARRYMGKTCFASFQDVETWLKKNHRGRKRQQKGVAKASTSGES